MKNPYKHVPVLLQETVDALEIKEHGIYVDGTLGSAGHSTAIAEKQIPITLIGIDADKDAISRSQAVLQDYSHITLHLVESYNDSLQDILRSLNIDAVDGILIDLGLSSDQLEVSGRGFSFQKDEPLDMRMRHDAQMTAASLIAHSAEEDLATILYHYADETHSRRIAKGIVEARELQPIETTLQLVEVIKASVPNYYLHRKTHPATRTFQALRIAVNDEITRLKNILSQSMKYLKNDGVLAVITFHSIEDRIVKQFMRQEHEQGTGFLSSKKPIKPSRDEIENNPRARSALLRTIKKTNYE